MVMYFKSKRAFNCLIQNGEVYTLRNPRSTGKDWVALNRKSDKIAEVEIEYVGRILLNPFSEEVFDISNKKGTHRIVGKLSDFVVKSGFNSVEEWINEFKCLNGNKRKQMAYLYRVRLLRVFG